MNAEIVKIVVHSLLRIATLFLWKPKRKEVVDPNEETVSDFQNEPSD